MFSASEPFLGAALNAGTARPRLAAGRLQRRLRQAQGGTSCSCDRRHRASSEAYDEVTKPEVAERERMLDVFAQSDAIHPRGLRAHTATQAPRPSRAGRPRDQCTDRRGDAGVHHGVPGPRRLSRVSAVAEGARRVATLFPQMGPGQLG